MRWLGILMFLAGLGLSFGPLDWVGALVGREIARETVFADGAFRPATIPLSPSLAPLEVRVAVEEDGRHDPASGEAALAMVIGHSGTSSFAAPIRLDGAGRTPLGGGAVLYDQPVTRLSELADGDYVFTVSEGDADEIGLRRVELVLRANAFESLPDPRFAGNVLLWLGAFAFFIGLRRRNRAGAGAPPPDAPKWGRQ